MTRHAIPIVTPSPIQYAQRARNGSVVQAATYVQIARATNHITGMMGKWLCHFCNANPPAGAAGTLTSYRAYIHTGHHVEAIRVNLSLVLPDNAAAVAPRVWVELLNVSTGANIATSSICHYGPIDAAASGGPDYRREATIEIDGDDFADDTAYWLQLYIDDYARVQGMSAYEVGSLDGTVDDAVTGAVDPRFVAGQPITDDQRLAIAAAQTEIIRTCRQPLWTWSVYDDTAPHAVTGTTATNLIDLASTSVSAASPGVYVNNQYHNTVSRTTVPCVIAAYAKSATLGGGTESALRLQDGSATHTVKVTHEGWYTFTANLSVSAANKWDVLGVSDHANRTISLWAIDVFEYE